MLKNRYQTFPTTMNNTNNASPDHQHQWLHYYQQITPAANPEVMTSGGASTGPGFSDSTSTIVTTSFTTNNTSSPSKSTSLGNNNSEFHLNPQASVGKPIRRRSRAPRKNPTTLLNASTTNFRSLVQQFTGCQNTKASAFGSRKGPVNLNFGMPRNQNDHQIISTSSRIAPVGSEYFHNQVLNPVVHDQHQGQQWQQQELFEKLQINNKNMQSGALDDFAINDLHKLINETSSFDTSVNKQDGNYYF